LVAHGDATLCVNIAIDPSIPCMRAQDAWSSDMRGFRAEPEYDDT
jgi:hypothetical protein